MHIFTTLCMFYAVRPALERFLRNKGFLNKHMAFSQTAYFPFICIGQNIASENF